MTEIEQEERLLKETTRLSDNDVYGTLLNAMGIANEKFTEHVKMFEDLAEALRNGHVEPMFAPGEAGAVAADRLADQFRRQIEDTTKLMELMMDADYVQLVVEDD